MSFTTLPIALTKTIRRQWDEYWADRPGCNPTDLAGVLEEVTQAPAEVASLLHLEDGRVAAVHPDCPGWAFIGAVHEGVETVYVCFRPIPKPKRVEPARKQPLPEEPVVDPLPGEPPDLSDTDRLAFWKSVHSNLLVKLASLRQGSKAHSAVQVNLAASKAKLVSCRANMPTSAPLATRSEYQRGRDKEYGRVRNLIGARIDKLDPDGPEATVLRAVADDLKSCLHRPAGERFDV